MQNQTFRPVEHSTVLYFYMTNSSSKLLLKIKPNRKDFFQTNNVGINRYLYAKNEIRSFLTSDTKINKLIKGLNVKSEIIKLKKNRGRNMTFV